MAIAMERQAAKAKHKPIAVCIWELTQIAKMIL